MSCGTPWDSLKCELQAYAGLILVLKGDWTNRGGPEVYCSDASEKGWSFATRTAPVLSARVMVVFWSVLVFAVRLAVNVLGNTLSNTWVLPIWRFKVIFMRWNDVVQNFPEICAELLSVDAWHPVDYGRFVQDEGLLLLEAPSALRAPQCACERHWNVRILFLLDNLALVLLLAKLRTRSFPVLAVIRCTYGITYRANCGCVTRGNAR